MGKGLINSKTQLSDAPMKTKEAPMKKTKEALMKKTKEAPMKTKKGGN
jgi:hypothetical protein